MKKLMFAAAALAAGVAVADVTSANVVGYVNKDTDADNHAMVTPSFANLAKDAKFTLKDLSVTGYNKSEWIGDMYDGGCFGGDFLLKVLNNDGSIAAEYYWIDYKAGFDEFVLEEEMGPGWFTYDDVEGAYVQLTDADLAAATFDQGQSFWVYGTGKQLVSAGGVTKEDIEFPTDPDNHTAVGNGSPITLTLGDFSVTGYDKSEWIGDMYDGGCFGGDFLLKILNNDGSIAAEYYWIDYKAGFDEFVLEEEMGPGWFTYDDVEGVYVELSKADLAEISIPVGQGFWVYGTSKSLVIPAPEGL